MVTLCNGKKLPFALYFKGVERENNSNIYPVDELFNDTAVLEKNRKVFTELKEGARIRLFFLPEFEEEYDKNAYCEIETNRYDENDEPVKFKIQMQKQLENGEWLYKGSNNEEFPWRMGYYPIHVYYHDRHYVGGIHVTPLHLQSIEVENIHNYLQEEVEGLMYDFVFSKKSFSSDTEFFLTKKWYYDYVRKLEEVYEPLMYAMNLIENNPESRIVSTYESTNKPGKISAKSLKWKNTPKGSASDQELVKKKKEVFDTQSNQWIKNILFLWKYDITEVKNSIQYDKNILEETYQALNAENKNYLEQKKIISGKTDVSDNKRRDIDSRILMTNKDIKETEKKIRSLNRFLVTCDQVVNKIVYFLQHTIFADIPRGKRQPILKNKQYHQIYVIYKFLKQIHEKEGEKEKQNAILKPTWLIYEYFCLVKVLSLLQYEGYVCVEGMDKTLLDNYFNDRIREGTKFVLEKEKKIIHIWYDHYHSHNAREAKERGEYFYSNHSKKKPDIKIDVFESELKGLKLKSSIVIDAKFRQLKDINNPEYENKTTEQLMSYYYFFHRDGGRPVIDNVICLFAGNETRAKSENNSISYLRFAPKFNGEEMKLFGEEDLKEIIKRYVN